MFALSSDFIESLDKVGPVEGAISGYRNFSHPPSQITVVSLPAGSGTPTVLEPAAVERQSPIAPYLVALMNVRLATKWLLPLLWLLLLVADINGMGVAQAQAPDLPGGSGAELPYDEAEAQAIDRMIMCPVCPAESIDQAQVPIARQMRRVVREMLAQGANRQEILDFFAQRYGQEILASPPKSGINLVAWIFPLVVVAVALGAGLLVIRSMSARQATEPSSTPRTDDELAPYLAMVDQELARSDASGGISQRSVDTSGQPAAGVHLSGEPPGEVDSGRDE